MSLLHLDRRADCRAVLVPLQAGIADDRLALLHDVAPADFEAWSTIARTTRHNLALCTESAP